MTENQRMVEPKPARISEEQLAEYWFDIRHRVFEQLRTAFHRSGIKQETIAARLGRNKSLISRWITGQENLTLRTMSYLARAMNCRLEINVRSLAELRPSNYNFDSDKGFRPILSGTSNVSTFPMVPYAQPSEPRTN